MCFDNKTKIKLQIFTGSLNDAYNYAVFKSQLNFGNGENACDQVGNVFVFNNDAYVGVVFVLGSKLSPYYFVFLMKKLFFRNWRIYNHS